MRRSLVVAGILVIVLAAGWLLSCSKSNPAAPVIAGGGELNGSLGTTGAQYAHTFAKTGTFNYECTIHPSCLSLQGTVVVVALNVGIQNRFLGITIDGGSSGPYGATCSALSVGLDSVKVGDQVTWTNNSPLPHTVTSR